MTSQLHNRSSIRLDGAGAEIEVAVRESERARKMRIIVGPRRPPQIVVPAGTPMSAVRGFLDKKQGWIERKVTASEEINRRPQSLGLAGQIWLGGEPLRVECSGRGSLARAELRDGLLRITGPVAGAQRAVGRWYRREARRRIAAVVDQETTRLNLSYNSVAIRDQKTRWGSCSSKGNLSFSWRLIICPPEVLEYVVVHELLHLRQHNHSKAFWRLLDAALPGWRAQSAWLREHEQELHEYLPRL